MDMLTTETGNIFPIQDYRHLETFNDFTAIDGNLKKFTHLWNHVGELLDMDHVSSSLEEKVKSIVQSTSVLGKSYYSFTPYELAKKWIFKFQFTSNLELEDED